MASDVRSSLQNGVLTNGDKRVTINSAEGSKHSAGLSKENGGISKVNGVVSKDNSEEFTIITTVDKTMPTSDSKLKDMSVDNRSSDKFQIIDYVDKSYVDKRATHFINPVYVVDDFPVETTTESDHNPDAINEVGALENGEHDKQPNESVQTNLERNSIIIDGEEVLLRKSPNERKIRSSRQQTWKTNQNVVSEAFGFLREEDDNEDTERVSSDSNNGVVSENSATDQQSEAISRSARQPTWKNNQRLVSQAFGFLKDIPGLTDRDSNDLEENTEMHEDFTYSYIDKPVDNSSVHKTTISDAIQNNSDFGEKLSENLQKTGNNHSSNVTKSSIGSQLPQNDNYKDLTNEIDSLEISNPNRASEASSIASEVGELGGYKKSKFRSNTGDDDGDSSDEDVGVYRESFRKSTWLYIGDKGGNKSDDFVPLSDLGMQTCETDSVFGDFPSENKNTGPHLDRSESTSTTVSERDFRNNFNSVSKRFVQRAESQQEYKRYTQKFYDNVETYNIEKTDRDSFGIHILDSKPAIVSGVDEGSPAEMAGLREGQVVISINGINVLESEHDEIIQLVHENGLNLTMEVGSGSMPPFLDLQLPVLTGHLQKQTSSTIFRLWKKRFFILRRDNCLYYYKNEQDTDPLGAIPMYGYTVSRHGDTNKFMFKAEKYNNKTFYFMAESRDDMTRWVGALNDVAKRQEEHKDSWMEVTAHNVGLPALEIRKPDCTGYLNKIGRSTKRWRKRYCVLKDACIYYYKNSNSKEALGVAHLHGYRVEKTGVASKKFSFCLEPPEPQMRVFMFYAENETDKLRYMETRGLNWERGKLDKAGVASKKFSFCLEPPEPQMRVFMFYAENETDKLRWIDALTVSIQKWIKVD